MGKRSPIAQKVEKNKRYAARHKFENTARIALGELHRKPDYEQNLIEVGRLTIKDGHVIKDEYGEIRSLMYADRPAKKSLTRKKITKWGKLYWAWYDDAELIKLERIRG